MHRWQRGMRVVARVLLTSVCESACAIVLYLCVAQQWSDLNVRLETRMSVWEELMERKFVKCVLCGAVRPRLCVCRRNS